MTGEEIIENALRKIGVSTAESPTDELLLGECELHGTAILEQLALDRQMVPGVSRWSFNTVAGRAEYTIGPTSEQTDNVDQQTDVTPLFCRSWAVVEASGNPSQVERDKGPPITDGGEWAKEYPRKLTRGEPGVMYWPGSGVFEGQRTIIFTPVPDAAYALVLYLGLPYITSLSTHQTHPTCLLYTSPSPRD